ncbi:MAG: YciI family protein [Acidobacteriota bacterium]|nr:YciI family protein [Acidobacteriota bacterium]
MTDDDRTGPEAWAARVNRDVDPPPFVRARVAEDLRRLGLLRSRRGTGARPWLGIAAALVLFASGWMAASAYHSPPAPAGPRFMFLLFGETAAPADLAARAEEYRAWAIDLRRRGGRVTGERLSDEAMTVGAPREGGTSLGGYFIVEAPSGDAARALAENHPHARHGGSIVIRPVAGS